MSRFHLPAAAWAASLLEGDEARHLTQVLRIRPGETITVFDGEGREAPATVVRVARNRVELAVGQAMATPAIRPAITLAQAIPKGKNMELIVQKAVELGVARVQPLLTRHTVVRPGDAKAAKWRRTALEACKQCGQNLLPEIAEPMPFAAWLKAAAPAGPDELRLIASLAPGARPLRAILGEHAAPPGATLLIGPEGDFSLDETAAALAAGCQPVSLGNIILRVETAALFALSALRYQYAM